MGLGSAPLAHAAPGDFAAAMGLSAADGSVRTQTSVRMSLSPVPGSDSVMVMSGPVQARMGDVRSCFATAMATNPRAEGRVVVQVETAPKGKAKTQVTLNETGDQALAECMSKALARTDLKAVKHPKAAVLVALDLVNPTARMREALDRKAEASKVPVRTLGGGRVQADGGTHEGEVRFQLTTSAFARPELERVHRDLSDHLAGLLDCRRKASKRGMKNDGSIELDLRVDAGKAVRSRTVHSDLTDRSAPQCVSTWFNKSLSASTSAEIALTVQFTR